MNSFHVRTSLPADQVKTGERRARRQEDELLDLFIRLSDRTLTAEDVKYRYDWPITSIRRALTNLHNSGKLIEEGKTLGSYGVSITKYRYRNPSDIQLTMQFAEAV